MAYIYNWVKLLPEAAEEWDPIGHVTPKREQIGKSAAPFKRG